jgi:uracil-DNA glycosylase
MAGPQTHLGSTPIELDLEPGWRAALANALATPGTESLRRDLLAEESAGIDIYPARAKIFAAFERTPFEQVRVVIVGQDPYHGPGQAMGLSFSVPRGVAVPPSLRNIFTELGSDLGVERPTHGDLTAWADQGVLLLNSSLTVRAGAAGSHARAGWQPITDAAIRAVSDQREHVVFLLWGTHARSKASLIDPSRHLVLEAAHPSPLSASKGFFGCHHFSRANAYLREHGQPPIDWSLPT